MKKETVIAIIFGVGLGVLVAILVIFQSKENKFLKTKPISNPENSLTPQMKIVNNPPFLEINNPSDRVVAETNSIRIKGKANKNSLIILESPINDLVFKNEKEEFQKNFPLALGENIIKITNYPADKNVPSISKQLRVYYLDIKDESAKFPFFNLTSSVMAQTKEATASSTDQIESFKEKIADKVSELTKEEQKAISGYVIKNGTSQLTIKTNENKSYIIKIDDILTKIYQISGTQKKEIKPSLIEKNDYLIVNGPTSDTSISANYIFIDEKFLVNSGKVSEVDKENYSLRLITPDKETINLEIEVSTKQTMLDIKTLEINRIGFSKIKEGDNIHFVVKKAQPDKKETSFSAIKILIIPQEYFIK